MTSIVGDRIASLIIWDEAPMTHRCALKAGEQSLRDLCNETQIFCGKIGDFWM